LGHIEVGDEIGRGGMGIVCNGWDGLLQRRVAIKFLTGVVTSDSDPSFQQFLEGARAEAAVRHPNLVTVHTADIYKAIPYVVMEYIDGPTVRGLLRRHGALALDAALHLMLDLSAGIGALHQRGIVHRDIKPSNVLVDHDGRAYVTDFGLAALSRRGEHVHAGGTFPYMAPEAFSGKMSPQVDVYAMGIMFYELLVGCCPFSGDREALREAHTHDDLPVEPLRNVAPENLVEVISRATQKKEVYRYKTAEHMSRALGNLHSDHVAGSGSNPVQRLVGHAHAASDDPTPPTPMSSSYFEKLSELAAQKQVLGSESRPLVVPGNKPKSDLHDYWARIHNDIRCKRCGYSLRWLRGEDACPECGTPVKRSLREDNLANVDPMWLRRLLWGCWLIILTPVVAAAVSVTNRFFGGRPGLDVGDWERCIIDVSLFPFAAGILMLTEVQPDWQGFGRWGGTARKLTRWLTVLTVVQIVLLHVPILYTAQIIFTLITGYAAVVGLSSYLSDVARHSDFDKLATVAGHTFVISVIAGVSMAAGWGVQSMVGWSTYLHFFLLAFGVLSSLMAVSLLFATLQRLLVLLRVCLHQAAMNAERAKEQ